MNTPRYGYCRWAHVHARRLASRPPELSTAAFLILTMAALSSQQCAAQKPPEEPATEEAGQGPTVPEPVSPKTVEKDLRELPPAQPRQPAEPVREVPDLRRSNPPSETSDPTVPETLSIDLGSLPAAEGASWPPEPRDESRPPHGCKYRIERSGVRIAVRHRSGEMVAGPFTFASFWQVSGSPCGAKTEAPPIVLYDLPVERWLLGRFATSVGRGGVHLCLAVARTTDPLTGGWYLYDFLLPVDLGGSEVDLAEDGYSLSFNQGGSLEVLVFDRKAMLAGAPATYTRATVADPPTP